MDVQIIYNDEDITNKVISYKYEQQICTGIGTVNFVFDSTFIIGNPWDTILLYENSVQQATYNVIGCVKNHDGNINVSAQDNSKRLVDYFITESYETGETLYYAKTWLVRFLNDVGVSYHFTVSGSGSPLSNNTSLGLMSAYDQIQQLLQQSGWYMYFNAGGTAIIGKAGLGSPKENFDETKILNIQTSKSDSKLRNRAVVWGNSNQLTDTQVFADISTNTPWNYDSTDKRAVVYANSNIYSTADANRIAHQILNEFSKIDYIKYIDVAGVYNLSVGNMVHIDSKYFSGNGVITSLEVSMSARGHITKLTLDERCSRLFAFYSLAPTYPDYTDNHVYVGTYGSGIWRKTITGADWEDVSNGLSNLFIIDLFINNGRYVCVAEDGYAYIKSYTTSWTKFSPTGFIFDTTTYLIADIQAVACTINSITNDIYILYRHRTENISWVVKNTSTGVYTVTLLETDVRNTIRGADIDTNDRDLFITTLGSGDECAKDAVISSNHIYGIINTVQTNTMKNYMVSLSESTATRIGTAFGEDHVCRHNYVYKCKSILTGDEFNHYYNYYAVRYNMETSEEEEVLIVVANNILETVKYSVFDDNIMYIVCPYDYESRSIGALTYSSIYHALYKVDFSLSTSTLILDLPEQDVIDPEPGGSGYIFRDYRIIDVISTLETPIILTYFDTKSESSAYTESSSYRTIRVGGGYFENYAEESGELGYTLTFSNFIIYNGKLIYTIVSVPYETGVGYSVVNYDLVVETGNSCTLYRILQLPYNQSYDVIICPYYSENLAYIVLGTSTYGDTYKYTYNFITNAITSTIAFNPVITGCVFANRGYYYNGNDLYDIHTRDLVVTKSSSSEYFLDQGSYDNTVFTCPYSSFTSSTTIKEYSTIDGSLVDSVNVTFPESTAISTRVLMSNTIFIFNINNSYLYAINNGEFPVTDAINSVIKGTPEGGFTEVKVLTSPYKVECSKEYPMTVYPITTSGDTVYISPFGDINTYDVIVLTSGQYTTDSRIFDIVSGVGCGRYIGYVLVSGTGGGVVPILIPTYDKFESLITTISGVVTVLETNNMDYEYSPYFFVGISGLLPRFFQRNSDTNIFLEVTSGLPYSNITVIRVDDRL